MCSFLLKLHKSTHCLFSLKAGFITLSSTGNSLHIAYVFCTLHDDTYRKQNVLYKLTLAQADWRQQLCFTVTHKTNHVDMKSSSHIGISPTCSLIDRWKATYIKAFQLKGRDSRRQMLPDELKSRQCFWLKPATPAVTPQTCQQAYLSHVLVSSCGWVSFTRE